MRSSGAFLVGCSVACTMLLAPVRAQDARPGQPGPVWPKLTAAERAEVMKFGDDFKRFIGAAKAREPVRPRSDEAARGRRLQAVAGGADEGRRRARLALVRRQSRPHHRRRSSSAPSRLTSGTRIVNTHNDSVRLELKPKPFRD